MRSSGFSSSLSLSIFPHHGGFIARLQRMALAAPRHILLGSHSRKQVPLRTCYDPKVSLPEPTWRGLRMPTLDPITVARGPKSSKWPGQVNRSTVASQHWMNTSQSTGLRVEDRVGLHGATKGLVLEGKVDVENLKWQVSGSKINVPGFLLCKLSGPSG